MSSKERIREAALIRFAEKGLDGTSIREISDAAGANVAMVSYYFGGKEALYLDCVSYFTEKTLSAIKSTLVPAETQEQAKERLIQLVDLMLFHFNEDKNAFKIIMRELQHERVGLTEKIFVIIHPVFEAICQFLETCIASGYIAPSFSALHLSTMFLGMITHPFQCEFAMQRSFGCTLDDASVRTIYAAHINQLLFKGVFS